MAPDRVVTSQASTAQSLHIRGNDIDNTTSGPKPLIHAVDNFVRVLELSAVAAHVEDLNVDTASHTAVSRQLATLSAQMNIKRQVQETTYHSDTLG